MNWIASGQMLMLLLGIMMVVLFSMKFIHWMEDKGKETWGVVIVISFLCLCCSFLAGIIQP